MSVEKRKIWVYPWTYIESFIIISALFIGAVLFEFIIGKAAPILMWPINFIILTFLLSTSVFVYFYSKRNKTIQWFGSIPASVGAITLFIFVSLIMALVPQNPNTKFLFFIYNVTSSWAYYIAIAYLLFILGIVTIKRFTPLHKKNIGFTLNHVGLWITIAAAGFGASDIQKFSMYLKEGEIVWQGYNTQQQVTSFDFAIKLNNFEIEEYPAKIAIINAKNGDFLTDKGKKAIYEGDTIRGISFKNYHIKIKKFLPTSMRFENTYFPISDIGATQSYFIEIINKTTHTIDSAWIGCASVTEKSTYYYVNDSTVIATLEPEAKQFSSDISIFTKKGDVSKATIEVNKPIKINSWKVYQTGYDTEKGRWSDISILEVVQDPWLPFVYLGICLLIFGSLFMAWEGRASRKE